jgi:hypothetical protein
MQRAIGLLLVAVGCVGGQHLVGDQDGTDGAVEGDSADAESGDEGTEGTLDARVEDGTIIEDGADAAPASRCPEVLAGEGPVRLAVRWRQVAPWAWASPGSAAFGVLGAVLLAVQPSSPWIVGSEPFNVWLDAETGELLPYERDRAVEGSRAMVMRDDGVQFDVGAFPPGYGTVASDLEGAVWEPDGRSLGCCWSRGAESLGLEILLADSARLVVGDGGPAGTVEGEAVGGGWGVDAGSLWDGPLFPLYRGTELPGDPFVALGRTSAAVRRLWTAGDELVLTDEGGVELRRVRLGWGAAYVPVSVSRDDVAGSDFLVAGRNSSAPSGAVMRVERRGMEDLAVISAHEFGAYEALVDRPEPRDMAGKGGMLALAWVAERLAGDDSRSLCLYLTPLDEDGALAGPAVRLDEGPVPADGVAVENVRLIVREGSFFVLWQRQPDMWLARVDHAE